MMRHIPVDDERWGKLFEFMQANDFNMQDFLACVCANFIRYPQTYYYTVITIGGYDFSVAIQKFMMPKDLQ